MILGDQNDGVLNGCNSSCLDGFGEWPSNTRSSARIQNASKLTPLWELPIAAPTLDRGQQLQNRPFERPGA